MTDSKTDHTAKPRASTVAQLPKDGQEDERGSCEEKQGAGQFDQYKPPVITSKTSVRRR
jgi:hypothetical protein